MDIAPCPLESLDFAVRPLLARRALTLGGVIAVALSSILAGGAQAQEAASQPEAEVVINGVLPSKDDTYRAPKVEVGPLGAQDLVNVPYSISVVPVQLAENQQLESVRELFRYIPSVQGENIRPQSRGMQAGVVQNTRIDGFNIAATTDYAIEQFERVEVLNGLAGALYGPASPAGDFNYVFKRPAETPLNVVTLAYSSQSSFIEHADISRQFAGDELGVRVNLLNQSGENYVDDSDLKRRLVSAALDTHLWPGGVLQFDLSHYEYIDTGFPGTFSLAQGVPFPKPTPDVTRLGYGLPWAGDDNTTDIFSGRLLQDLSSSWKLTGGVLYMTNDRTSTAPTDTITSTSGSYIATTVNTTFSLDRVLSNNATLSGDLMVAGLHNSLFIGTTGFSWQRYTPYHTGAITLGTATLADPVSFAQPALPDFKDRYESQDTEQQSVSIGDTLDITPQFSVMAALSQSWITSVNINSTAAITSSYEGDGLSPTASLIYKPAAGMTAYVTYADSLQQGDVAPAGTVNAGDSLAPYRSREWEAGYKANLTGVDVSFALYQIERPYAFTAPDRVFALGGDQRNRGLELSANGHVTSDLNILGAISLLDPRLINTASASIDDKQILGLSKVTLDVLLEYRVPALPELTLAANVNYASRRAGNYMNTDYVDPYTVVDLDARYLLRVKNRPVVLRLAMENVGDEHYWANVAPVGQNGYTGTDNGTATLGAPRTYRASIEVGF